MTVLEGRIHQVLVLLPNMLSPEQVADIMNVSKETVYRMVRRGDYDSLKLGRIIRIPKACVLNYIVANLA